jgi:hypothetical protein
MNTAQTNNEGFVTGLAVGAASAMIYRFLKDTIGKYLTTKFNNHPVTEKTIDKLLSISSKLSGVNPSNTEEIKNEIMGAVQSGEIKTIKDLSSWFDKQLQQSKQGKMFECVEKNNFKLIK